LGFSALLGAGAVLVENWRDVLPFHFQRRIAGDWPFRLHYFEESKQEAAE